MVWFFGGDFVTGDSSEDNYPPDLFMDSSLVVMVTVSYRVGPFGFLSLGTEKVPGNMVKTEQAYFW